MSESSAALEQAVDRLFTELAGRKARDPADIRPQWQAIAEFGLPDLLLPEASGGFGGSWLDAAFVFAALGRHGLALPVGEAVLAHRWLHEAGAEIPEGIGTFAFAADLDRVPWGMSADWVLVLDGPEWRLMAAAGCEPGTNLAGDPRDRIHMTVTSTATGRLGRSSAALFAEAALLRTCQISGAIGTMLAMSVDYANQRVQFGRPIGRLQAIQQQLALLAAESAAAACAAVSAAQATAGGDGGFEIAAAKWRANRAAGLAADIAHQVHGAIGITREFPLHAFTLRAQAWAAEYGNERHWARWLGDFVTAEPRRPLWHRLTERSDQLLDGTAEMEQ
jgi:acyl-CoA dehydrogenase